MNHIGIDLGTTNSVACTMKDGRFAFLDFRRTDLLPSVLLYQGGKMTVGNAAKRKREAYPKNYISSSKTHMGEREALWTIEDRSFTPTDVAAEVLSEIYRAAKKFFANDEPIEAVITTPAYFNPLQNAATQDAGEKAGFLIKQILAEPIAAALAYAMDDCHPGEKIFVVDLGGGTFDVTLLKVVSGNEFEVVWKDGDNHLGGDDFDAAILELMYREIRISTGVDLSEPEGSGLPSDDYAKAVQKLRAEAERCKCKLSEAEATEASVPSLFPYRDGRYNFSLEITRQEFLDEASLAVNKVKNTVRHFFDADGIEATKDDVDRVILVGGSARMPFVHEFVTSFFRKEPYADKDLAKLVAMGAALKADDNDTIILRDRLTNSMGIELVNDRYAILLPKGTPYPCDNADAPDDERIFTTVRDYQERIDIEVYVGENKENVKKNLHYGGFPLEGIERAPEGVPQIEVIFSFDQSQILHVHARDLKTGASGSKELKIDRS